MISIFPWPLVAFSSGVADHNPLTRASTRFYWYISGVKSLGILERRLRANPLGARRTETTPLVRPSAPPAVRSFPRAPVLAPRNLLHFASRCASLVVAHLFRVHYHMRVRTYECACVNALININVCHDINDGKCRRLGKGMFSPRRYPVVTPSRYCHVLSSLRKNCLANRSR